MIFIFIPLQFLAMWTTLSVFFGKPGEERSLELKALDGFVGALLLFVTNMGRTLNYEGVSKQHELISLQMQWLLDELDMIEHELKMGKSAITRRKKEFDVGASSLVLGDTEDDAAEFIQRQGRRFYQDEIDQRFEKIESNYFANSQNVQSLLPERIALPYAKLSFTLTLMLRPIGVVSGGNVSCVKMDDGKFEVDDKTYYRIINFAYSELAVVLGNYMGVFLPHPDRAVDQTIRNVTKMLCSGNQDSFLEKLLSPTKNSTDNNNNSRYAQGPNRRITDIDENDNTSTSNVSNNNLTAKNGDTDFEMYSLSATIPTKSEDEEIQQQVVNDV